MSRSLQRLPISITTWEWTDMNFSTQALEFFKTLAVRMQGRPNFSFDLKCVIGTMSGLVAATKFLLPHNGEVGIDVLDQKTFDLVRMPYPHIVFEYTAAPDAIEGNISSTRRLAFLAEFEKDNRRGIFVQSMYETAGIWVIVPIGVFVPYEAEVVVMENNIPRIAADTIITMPGTFYEAMVGSGKTEQQLLAGFVADSQEELFASLKALACLNARNVKEVSIPAPEKLNKKRVKNSKYPFFEYKTLNIFLGETAINIRPKDRSAIATKLFRQQARLHTVRGHFKRKKNGIFWWSSFIRGSAKAGEIKKDYKLE